MSLSLSQWKLCESAAMDGAPVFNLWHLCLSGVGALVYGLVELVQTEASMVRTL
jgi:hypothetical protein